MIHQQLVCDLHLLIVLSSACIRVTAADDQPIGDGRLTHQIAPIKLQIALLHTEEIKLSTHPKASQNLEKFLTH